MLFRSLKQQLDKQVEANQEITKGAPLSAESMQRHGFAQELAQQLKPKERDDQGPMSDPLVVWPPEDDDLDSYRFCPDDSEGDWDEESPDGPFAVDIAPDACHKANYSGGDSYRIVFPDAAIDGPVLGRDQPQLFVAYLRECFRFGGFPGLREHASAAEEISFLTNDLLPI